MAGDQSAASRAICTAGPASLQQHKNALHCTPDLWSGAQRPKARLLTSALQEGPCTTYVSPHSRDQVGISPVEVHQALQRLLTNMQLAVPQPDTCGFQEVLVHATGLHSGMPHLPGLKFDCGCRGAMYL